MTSVEFTPKAEKQLSKLDNSVQKSIKKWKEELETLENPKSRGKALSSNLKGFWRYRVNDYRLICEIQDDKLIVLVLEIAHRKNIYD
ncbi:MAG: type II toxin-antitoxin system RelE/ParE family toxin [Campylobacteraceae bacterium]|jgi:mRNA interferase RelE/StbE|nr:type II toxin-antitoxin system RelE/ParE family toxin [Campylobacteraceae bacterium]